MGDTQPGGQNPGKSQADMEKLAVSPTKNMGMMYKRIRSGWWLVIRDNDDVLPGIFFWVGFPTSINRPEV